MTTHPAPERAPESPHNELIRILGEAQRLQIHLATASRSAKARMNHLPPHVNSWRQMVVELGRFSDALADYLEKAL